MKAKRHHKRKGKRNLRRRFKRKRDRLVHDILVYHPRKGQFMPKEFVTDLYTECRFSLALGSAVSMSGNTQYFDVQAGQCYNIYGANAATGFVGFGGAAPAVTALGSYNVTITPVGFTSLCGTSTAGIYTKYLPLSSKISLTVDNYSTNTDEIRFYIMPLQVTYQGTASGVTNITNEYQMARQRQSVNKQWNDFTNVTVSPLVNKINWAKYLGYGSMKEYLADRYDNSYTNDANQQPGNEVYWQIAWTSGLAGAMTGTTQFVIKTKQRVLFYDLNQNISS